jgi:hypothetical protein
MTEWDLKNVDTIIAQQINPDDPNLDLTTVF